MFNFLLQNGLAFCRRLSSPWKPEVLCLGHEPSRLLKIFRQNDLLVAKVVQDVTEQNSITIDEKFALKQMQ